MPDSRQPQHVRRQLHHITVAPPPQKKLDTLDNNKRRTPAQHHNNAEIIILHNTKLSHSFIIVFEKLFINYF
jgi:hypothetical protein